MEAISSIRGAGIYGKQGELSPPNFDRSSLIFFDLKLLNNSIKSRLCPSRVFRPSGVPSSFHPLPKLCFEMVLPDKQVVIYFEKSFSQSSGSVKVVRVRGMYISMEAQKAFPSPPTVVDALLCVPRDVRSLPRCRRSPRRRRSPHRPTYPRPPAAMTAATGLAGQP